MAVTNFGIPLTIGSRLCEGNQKGGIMPIYHQKEQSFFAYIYYITNNLFCNS